MDHNWIFIIYFGLCFSYIHGATGQQAHPAGLCPFISTNYDRIIEATSKWTTSGSTTGTYTPSTDGGKKTTQEEDTSTTSYTTRGETTLTDSYTTNGETTEGSTTRIYNPSSDRDTTPQENTPTTSYTTKGEMSSTASYTTNEQMMTIRRQSTEQDISTSQDLTSTEGYTTAETRGCPISYNHSFNGSCYKFPYTDKLTHTDAKRDCATVGAHLLFVETEEEYVFIYNLSLQIFGGQLYKTWVGANGDADNIYWDDGSPANTTSFFQRDVTLFKWESRCYMTSTGDMRVREDEYCTAYKRFICEYEDDNQFVYHDDINLYLEPDPIIPSWDWERNNSHVISTMELTFFNGVPVDVKSTELFRGFHHVIYSRSETSTGRRLTCSFKIYTCPRNFNHYLNGSCYNVRYSPYYLTHKKASQYCRKYNSYLMIIDGENDVSYLQVQEVGLSFWIGMNVNMDIDSWYYWENGVTVNLTWDGISITEKHTIAHTDCYLVFIEDGGVLKIENSRCYHYKQFICEFRASSPVGDMCTDDLLLSYNEEFNSSLVSVADGTVTHFDGVPAVAVPSSFFVPCGTHHVIYQSPGNSWCFFRMIWECDPWATFGSSSYGFFSDVHRWYDSYNLCSRMHDARLAVIDNAEENEFIRQQLSSSTWIGLRQSSSEYQWYYGPEVTYTNWAEGYPTTEYNYVIMDSTDGTWRDRPLEYHSRICERDNP